MSEILAHSTNEDYELPSKSTSSYLTYEDYEVTSKSTSSSMPDNDPSQSDENGGQFNAPAGHHLCTTVKSLDAQLVTNEDYDMARTWFDEFLMAPSNSPNVPLQASTPLGTPDNEASQSSQNGGQFDVQASNTCVPIHLDAPHEAQ